MKLTKRMKKLWIILFTCVGIIELNAGEYNLPPTPSFGVGVYSIFYPDAKYIGLASRTWLPYKFGLEIDYTLATFEYKLLYILTEKNKYRGYLGTDGCVWIGGYSVPGYSFPIFLFGIEMQPFSYPIIFSPEAAFRFDTGKWELGFNLNLYKPLITPKIIPSDEKWMSKEKSIVTRSTLVGTIFAGLASSLSWLPTVTYEENDEIYLKLSPILINIGGGTVAGFLTGKMTTSWVRGDGWHLRLLKGAVAGMIGGIIWDSILLGTYMLYPIIGGEFPEFGPDPWGMETGLAYAFLVGAPLVSGIGVGIIGGGIAGLYAR